PPDIRTGLPTKEMPGTRRTATQRAAALTSSRTSNRMIASSVKAPAYSPRSLRPAFDFGRIQWPGNKTGKEDSGHDAAQFEDRGGARRDRPHGRAGGAGSGADGGHLRQRDRRVDAWGGLRDGRADRRQSRRQVEHRERDLW